MFIITAIVAVKGHQHTNRSKQMHHLFRAHHQVQHFQTVQRLVICSEQMVHLPGVLVTITTILCSTSSAIRNHFSTLPLLGWASSLRSAMEFLYIYANMFAQVRLL